MPTGTQLHDVIGSEIGARPAGELDSLTVSVWETILIFAVPVIGLYALIVLLVVAPRHSRRAAVPRRRAVAVRAAVLDGEPARARTCRRPDGHADDRRGERGGARGSW